MGKFTLVSPNNTDMPSTSGKGAGAKIGGNSKPVVSPADTQSPVKGGGIGTKAAPIKSPVPGK